MNLFKAWMIVLVSLCSLLQSRGAHAQWAVIDVGAIAQLIQEVSTLEQSLQTAQGELQQAQAQYQSLTGTRGMQNLLAGQLRNYLPTSLSGLTTSLQGGSGFASLTSAMQSASQSNALLNAQQLAILPPEDRQRLVEARNTVALLQGLTGTAVANASGRFSSLQQLIEAIGGAADPKAVMDLQARIVAEQGMLQNEQTKLQSLYQAAQAQHWSDQQRTREQVVLGHGDFASRFEPVP